MKSTSMYLFYEIGFAFGTIREIVEENILDYLQQLFLNFTFEIGILLYLCFGEG